MAVEQENAEIVKLLLSNGKTNVNAVNLSECYTVIDNVGCYDLYKYERTALYMAILKGNIEIIKRLLSKSDINVNIINVVTYSHFYSEKSDSDSSYFSDEPDIDWNKQHLMKEKQTALYLALLNKNEEILNLLLRNKNIHLNEYNLIGLNDDDRKITALHFCVEKGYLDIAKQLISFD